MGLWVRSGHVLEPCASCYGVKNTEVSENTLYVPTPRETRPQSAEKRDIDGRDESDSVPKKEVVYLVEPVRVSVIPQLPQIRKLDR